MEYLGALIINKMSMAHVYFREHGIEKYTTDEIYTITDLIGKISKPVSQSSRDKCQLGIITLETYSLPHFIDSYIL